LGNGFTPIQARILRFIADSGDDIAKVGHAIPVHLPTQQADCWCELLRIADFVGGGWPSRAHKVAKILAGAANYGERGKNFSKMANRIGGQKK